jgi:arylsulfatase
VTIDTLRADRLGCYGYFRNTTPTLDDFSRESVLLERVMTPMATTLPAHVSLMTGTYPRTHGVQNNKTPFQGGRNGHELRTLSEILKSAGYRTAAFVSGATLKRHTGVDRGFDRFSQPALVQRSAELTTDRALEWLKKNRHARIFLWVHYFDPHWPYDPPADHRNRFSVDEALTRYLQNLQHPEPTSRRILNANNRYDAEIRATDDQVARLFAALKRLGLWQSSIVVVAADHGEGMGQHHWMHHGEIHNEQLHVPLIMRWPGSTVPPGTRVPRVASLIDLLPTLAGNTEIPIPAAEVQKMEGIDLLNPASTRTYVLSERVHRRNRNWEPGFKITLSSSDWKYIRRSSGPDLLFDLARDPHETQDVLVQHPAVAQRMAEMLGIHIGDQALTESEPEREVSSEIQEQLRALGYAEPPR